MLYTPAFWAMAVANLCQTASFGAFFLLPLFILEHGGDQGDVGVVMGAFALASAVCRPWVSEMIDRIGRKRSYSLGSLIMVIAPLCYLLFDGALPQFYWPLLLLRVIHGIGMGICFTAIFTFMADVIPTERFNEGVGMFGISGLVGVALGPLLAEAVLKQAGYHGFFLAAMALALISFVVHLPLKESLCHSQATEGPSFFALLTRGKFVVVALLSLLFGIGLAGSGGFVAPLAEERGLGVISFYYLCYSGGAIATRFVGGRLADRYGDNRILPYGLGFYGVGLLLLPLTQSQFLLCLAGTCAGLGHGLLFPTLNTMAVRGEPASIRGKATGIFTGAIDTGAFAGSVVLGYIGSWFGLNCLFVTAGVATLAGLVLFRFRPTRKELTT
jgi:MFS family permease